MTTAGPAQNVLVVCTANIARSPYAEQVVATALDALVTPRPRVGSAGLAAYPGAPAVPEMISIGHARGYDLTRHRSRPLDRTLTRGTELVLTMTAAQQQQVQRLLPAATARTFTLAEFAELLAAQPVTPRASLPELVRMAHSRRPYVHLAGGDGDVGDPYGGPHSAYVAAADVIDRLVARVAEALHPR